MTQKEIAEIYNIPRQTVAKWKKERPEVYKALIFNANNQEQDINEKIRYEMIEAINKLPEHKRKKFYYLMMAELTEIGD